MWQMTRRSMGPLMACAVALAATGALRAAESGQRAGPGSNEVYFGTFYKPVCDKVVSGFQTDTSASWPVWERLNHAAVAALEANGDFQASRREALVPPPPELAEAKSKELGVTCERVANLYDASLPTDVRFNAPARTWETFRKALSEGKRDVIRSCLTGDARRTLTAPLQAMTDEQLHRMAESVAELKLMEANGAYQEAIVVQKDGNVGRVSFIRNGANWKIAQM